MCVKTPNSLFSSILLSSDFTVGGYTFEVGGKNKSQKQVHDVENVYVVKDDIEYGMRNVVPLWAFGFLY